MFYYYLGWVTKTLCTQEDANSFSLWNNNLGYQGILELLSQPQSFNQPFDSCLIFVNPANNFDSSIPLALFKNILTHTNVAYNSDYSLKFPGGIRKIWFSGEGLTHIYILSNIIGLW
jgi:hypothetical protein